MALYISMYTAAPVGGTAHLRQHLLHLLIGKLLERRSGLPMPRAITAVASVIDRSRSPSSSRVCLPEKSRSRRLLCGVVADVARRDHGHFRSGSKRMSEYSHPLNHADRRQIVLHEIRGAQMQNVSSR